MNFKVFTFVVLVVVLALCQQSSAGMPDMAGGMPGMPGGMSDMAGQMAGMAEQAQSAMPNPSGMDPVEEFKKHVPM